jgi:pyruvate dehydrogenase E2 component (dihydrolipoamide acetyltransferase)
VAYEFKLPDIGEGVAEAEIVKWLVAVGDQVKEDQPLVEVLTDKATVEIPSPRAGRVARLGGAEGATVPVGSVLVEIEEAGSSPAPAPSRVEAVPAARQLAKERGLDLATVTGSGPNGRILLEDIQKASMPIAHDALDERIPLRGLRKKIAEHMTQAARNLPQFTFVAEVDMSAVARDRAARKADAEANGVKLTYLAYVVRALVPALAKFPLLNASLDEAKGEIVLKKRYDIGIATATDEGLVVPIVHNADAHDLYGLARAIEKLAAAAREKKLALDDLTGGTFTVTSTGAKGGLLATPIVHHPQVAILGVHAVTPRAVVRDGQVVAREMTNLSLSLDHRVVDGQVGADFLYDVIARLETS